MEQHEIVSPQAWRAARVAFLQREKEFTRLRDELGEALRRLPWERIDKPYMFETPAGQRSLAQLFEGRHQLIVQHFMLGPDWEAGCKSCSFWADSYEGAVVHLNQRDVTFTAVSRAPLAKIEAFKARMGWSFPWASSFGSDFNFDFHVSFTEAEQAARTGEYNYAPRKYQSSELPGTSVFWRDDDDAVFHTYSTYARGIDMLNGAYQYLDLVPKGRDEAGLPFAMSWVKLHDHYGT